MQDNPQPSPDPLDPTTQTPSPRVGDPSSAPSESVTADPAMMGTPITSPPQGPQKPPKPTQKAPSWVEVFTDRVKEFALNTMVLAAVWVVCFLAFWQLMQMKQCDAVGFALVATLVASFFIRPLVPQLSQKHVTHTPQQIDSTREIVETIVFVVVLVLLLKSFVAEAFVIPTGSMAETLFGYQKMVVCPSCGLEFPVNCSSEVDPQEGQRNAVVSGCTCPACRKAIEFVTADARPNPEVSFIRDPGWRSGDRVLVAKFVYDLFKLDPDRLDVVVFKFPGEQGFFPHAKGPIQRQIPINYIKRLVGRPGETIAVHRGKLWSISQEKGPSYPEALADDKPVDPRLLWQSKYTFHNYEKALELFKQGKFDIVRKKPENMLSMRRIVYDNDHQAKDLYEGPKADDFRRWVPTKDTSWAASGKTAFAFNGEAEGWLRYRHVLRNGGGNPQLITDFMAYNTWRAGQGHPHHSPGENWASDLMLECEVDIAQQTGHFFLELSRGADRFQAAFNLENGMCTLYRYAGNEKEPIELAKAQTKLTSKGIHQVRFANFDDRLTLWVDESLAFGDGVPYEPILNLVPTRKNDLERPVNIGARSANLKVAKLKIYRDTYYTSGSNGNVSQPDDPQFRPDDEKTWANLESLPVASYYVQPGHYLCLGDNSPESSDGRNWGLVPQRLMLGRALMVYYPFCRAGRIK